MTTGAAGMARTHRDSRGWRAGGLRSAEVHAGAHAAAPGAAQAGGRQSERGRPPDRRPHPRPPCHLVYAAGRWHRGGGGVRSDRVMTTHTHCACASESRTRLRSPSLSPDGLQLRPRERGTVCPRTELGSAESRRHTSRHRAPASTAPGAAPTPGLAPLPPDLLSLLGKCWFRVFTMILFTSD